GGDTRTDRLPRSQHIGRHGRIPAGPVSAVRLGVGPPRRSAQPGAGTRDRAAGRSLGTDNRGVTNRSASYLAAGWRTSSEPERRNRGSGVWPSDGGEGGRVQYLSRPR